MGQLWANCSVDFARLLPNAERVATYGDPFFGCGEGGIQFTPSRNGGSDLDFRRNLLNAHSLTASSRFDALVVAEHAYTANQRQFNVQFWESIDTALSEPSNAPTPARRPALRSFYTASPRRRRRDATIGLPNDADLRKLASTFVQVNRREWPELVAAGLLPEPSELVLDSMVDSFKARFQSGVVTSPSALNLSVGVGLAAAYVRFSDDNSNPRSLDDQLTNILVRARRDQRFIPWEYVFADSAVTGRDPLRRGYRHMKSALVDPTHAAMQVIYIDDFSRAGRQAVEWLSFAQMVRQSGSAKNVIGVSDGFDLQSPAGKMLLHVFAMMVEWFSDQLASKVSRGMRGAVRRGTVTGAPPAGYVVVPKRDASGQVVMNAAKGKPINVLAIDWGTPEQPGAMKHVLDAYHAVDQNRSVAEVAQRFNELRLRGSTTWNAASVKALLRRHLYIGVKVHNRVRYVKDSMTGKLRTIRNPRREWITKWEPTLSVVPRQLWRRVNRRLAELEARNPRTGKPMIRRQHAYPDWLLSGTLVCGCCGELITIVQCNEAKGYVQLGCPRGVRGKDCTMRVSRSKQRVEAVVLDYLRRVLLTDEMAAALVEACNAALAAEAAKPRIDTSPMRQHRDALLVKQRQLAESLMEPATDQHRAAEKTLSGPKVVLELIAKLQSESDALDEQIRESEKANRSSSVTPINAEQMRQAFGSLAELLNCDVRSAALALRKITGPIRVTPVPHPRRDRRQTWKLSFTPRLEQALCLANEREAQQRQYKEVAGLLARQQSASRSEDPSAGSVELHVDSPKPSKRSAQPKPLRLVESSAERVARMRHDQNLSLREIAVEINVPLWTVERAHRLWHRRHPDWTGGVPLVVLCDRHGHLSPTQRRDALLAHADGERPVDIARRLGVKQWVLENLLASARRADRFPPLVE